MWNIQCQVFHSKFWLSFFFGLHSKIGRQFHYRRSRNQSLRFIEHKLLQRRWASIVWWRRYRRLERWSSEKVSWAMQLFARMQNYQLRYCHWPSQNRLWGNITCKQFESWNIRWVRFCLVLKKKFQFLFEWNFQLTISMDFWILSKNQLFDRFLFSIKPSNILISFKDTSVTTLKRTETFTITVSSNIKIINLCKNSY